MIVSLREPFSIELQIMEIEHRYPSIKINAKVVDDRFAGKLFFEKEVWLDGATWEDFVAKLASCHSIQDIDASTELRLPDMNQFFLLQIFKSQDKVIISISFERDYKSQTSKFSVGGEIDGETFAHIQRAFDELASAV